MPDADLEHNRRAGRILAGVRDAARERVSPGARLLDVAEAIEADIRARGAEPAFPVNISRNEQAAHYTPPPEDGSAFADDVVKLDIGVHVDGYIADTAFTVDLRGVPGLVRASEAGLQAALEMVRAGVTPGEIGTAIEKAIEAHGFRPIYNLTGHGLGRWTQHAPPTIPNYAVRGGVKLKAGQVVAIEPFATDGAGRVGETRQVEIYSLAAGRSVRQPDARELLKRVEPYRTLPFARRWVDAPKRDFLLAQLARQGVLRGYGVLRELSGGLVSQAEHTVIVTEDGCEVTTG